MVYGFEKASEKVINLLVLFGLYLLKNFLCARAHGEIFLTSSKLKNNSKH
jgi:hypothetical protein